MRVTKEQLDKTIEAIKESTRICRDEGVLLSRSDHYIYNLDIDQVQEIANWYPLDRTDFKNDSLFRLKITPVVSIVFACSDRNL